MFQWSQVIRAGATVLKPIFLPIGDQDLLRMVSQLDDIFVCDQDGGTPLDSDLDQGAGEEANSPAGGARGVGGVVVGGVSIFTRKFEEGNRSLFLGGSFVQCDDIPLIMAGGKIQSRK